MHARACGGLGLTVTEPAACGDILEQALNASGPVLVEAVVDPYEPPLPGKIKPEQALRFAESLARGQPKRMRIVNTILEDRVKELV
jgi:pyruvate dehydrogenase (quinone)/pyruvate oxidase